MRPGPELALAALMLAAAAPPAAAQVQQALRVPAAKVFAADLLPKVPSAEAIYLDENGQIEGLF